MLNAKPRQSVEDKKMIWPYGTRVSINSVYSQTLRPAGTIQEEVVAHLFESMVGCIVESWEVITSDETANVTLVHNNLTVDGSAEKIRRRSARRSTLAKAFPSKSSFTEMDPIYRIWFISYEKEVLIKFKNGNTYHGDISLKCMNGDGCFRWADGTVYVGHFKNNKMNGQGKITWKDDTWYQGEFKDNLREGYGLYVDSRRQRSYFGGWQRGTKHGDGKMCYSDNIYESYDGGWEKNCRDGYGLREYCRMSGYRGDWSRNEKEGKGMMIWPNGDFYTGFWKDGLMSGKGMYVWNMPINFSMSVPIIMAYQGDWQQGKRHGTGLITFGHPMGARYKGHFSRNVKHGSGKLVTENGTVEKKTYLFDEDNFAFFTSGEKTVEELIHKVTHDIINDRINLYYHMHRAYIKLDRQTELRARIINKYIKYNDPRHIQIDFVKPNPEFISEFFDFEIAQLFRVIHGFEPMLKRIYYKYAKIFNKEKIKFTPVMIRLQLWQLYYDCNIHRQGLTLVDADNLLYNNPEWLVNKRHDPFETIYYWQYLHSLICVSRRLYGKRELPGPKPNTIMASAFRKFMEFDVIPNIMSHRGYLLSHCHYMPLDALYKLYLALGDEPPTIAMFLRAVRKLYHEDDHNDFEDQTSVEDIIVGHNAYMVANDLSYVVEDPFSSEAKAHKLRLKEDESPPKPRTMLWNFANLSMACIIDIFAQIFSGLTDSGKLYHLDIKMTFFEFFEAFITCAFMSVKTEEEERFRQMRLRAFQRRILAQKSSRQSQVSTRVHSFIH